MKSSTLSLNVYKKGEEIPFPLLQQIKEFQSEGILDFISDPYTFDVGIVTDDSGRVLGVGVIRVIAEFKMQLNPSLSNNDKAILVKELMNEAISRRPCGEIIVMVTQGGPHYVNFLQKHFDFNKIDGTPLKWEA